ncbi:cytochrome c maturation protein CcmE [Deferribacterales bacterium RsTz2092]|nr:cytochrome C biogenesis protein CcmE [Deferribacterales bacterium]
MRNYKKYAIAFAIAAVALAYFIMMGLSVGGLYYKDISEVVATNEQSAKPAQSKGLRVAGTVADNEFRVDRFGRTANFTMKDGGYSMAVAYRGTIPDAFEVGAQVVVEGVYDADRGEFVARKLLAKCPSKYEAQPDDNKL